MRDARPEPFALDGAEKMLYDARMGPQAVLHEGVIHVVYQGGPDELLGHPHIVSHDVATRRWSQPRRLGEVDGLDHHYAPILWTDDDGHFHVCYGCHASPGVHLASRRAGAIDEWADSPKLGPSISYPLILRSPGRRRVMIYRVEGHLGYWVWRVSDDGKDWSPERTMLDFDRDPSDEPDRWAGSYVGACLSRDARSLHLGFTYWDERRNMHPVYTFRRDLLTRYNLYYLRLDVETGELTTIDGRPMRAPVNRRQADACKVLDTGIELTNFPTVATGPNDEPFLLVPVSEDTPWTCGFHFFRHDGRQWRSAALAQTDNTWSGSRLLVDDDGRIEAQIIVGRDKGEECFYGGGTLERWTSIDGGDTWRRDGTLVPERGRLYNNPKPVERSEGGPLDDALVLYGWEGPTGVWATDPAEGELPNRGRAYLWLNGEWA